MIRAVICLVALVGIPQACYSASIEHCWTYSTLDLNDCMGRVLARAERYLALAHRDVLEEISDTRYVGDESEVKKQRKAVSGAVHIAKAKWQAVRKVDCGAVYKEAEQGTIRNMVFLQCMIARTEQRTLELQNWRQWKAKSMIESGAALKKALSDAESQLDAIDEHNLRQIEESFLSEEQRSELKKLMHSGRTLWNQYLRADCEIPYRDIKTGYEFEDDTVALQCQVARTERRIQEMQKWNDWRF